MKKIKILGAGLTGCLSAIKIKKKFSDIEVELVDSGSSILSSFLSLSISNYKVNNGFHGIEFPRAEPLVKFFEEELHLYLDKDLNRRGLLIDGYFLDSKDKQDSWPSSLYQVLNSEPKVICNLSSNEFYISERYTNYLKNISKRYSDNFEDAISLLVPWFLPSDYVFPETDEGNNFRNKVKKGEVNASYFYPQQRLFETLIPVFLEKLSELEVVLTLNSTLSLSDIENDLRSFKSKYDHVLITTLPLGFLKTMDSALFSSLTENKRYLVNSIIECNKDVMDGFSELLCAEERFSEVSRISQIPSNSLHYKKALQMESFIRTEADFLDLEMKIRKFSNQFFDSDARLVGSKISRQVYFPNSKIVIQAMDEFYRWRNQYNGKVSLVNQIGPINMSKAFLFAEEFTSIIGGLYE